jgi:predicted nucleic acid-binding protein
VIVVDASVLATALADDGSGGAEVRDRLRGERLAAPEIVDLEVLSVLRRLTAAGDISSIRANQAADDLADLPLRRAAHLPLVRRCWELRDNVTPYDAAYVALAEALEVTFLTADARLARSPGTRCRIELVTAAA